MVRTEHATGYQHRRDTNRARLREVDLLIAQSTRVGQLYRTFGADSGNLRTLNLTLAHLRAIRPHAFPSLDGPMRFVTLNGCYTRPKGAHIMLDALRLLATRGFSGAFELHSWGGLSSELAEQFRSFPNFRHHDWYKPDQLNAILDEAHVGIIPSVWEEAFGYVGLEYLAKGVPIIGNAKGGITDYTRDGVTGWLNHSNDGPGLASLMEHCISHPEDVLVLNRRINDHRSTLLKGMTEHKNEIDLLYREAAERRRVRTREAVCAG
jgi:glycosyltransferase involved in cell wall biosynthesis